MKTSYKKTRKVSISSNKTTKPRKLFKCAECKKYFRRQHLLTKHMNNLHKKPSGDMLTCELCGGTFTDRANIVKHIGFHSKTPVCFCTLCNETFVEFDDLEAHVNICRKSKKEILRGLGQGTDAHQSNQDEDEEQDDIISTNQRIFPSCSRSKGRSAKCSPIVENCRDSLTPGYYEDTVEDVIVKKGSPDRDFVCEICGIQFQGLFTLTDHYLIHEAKDTETEDNSLSEFVQTEKTSNEVDEYWKYHSWDSERSLVYSKDSDEKLSHWEYTGKYQTHENAFHNFEGETQIVPSIGEIPYLNSHAAHSKQTENTSVGMEFDSSEFIGWSSSAVSSPDCFEANATDIVFSGIIEHLGTSDILYGESIGGQFKTYVMCSRSSETPYQSYRQSVCDIGHNNQQYSQEDTNPESKPSITQNDHDISMMNNLDFDSINGGQSISVQSFSRDEDFFFEKFISPSEFSTAVSDSDFVNTEFDKTFQCFLCQAYFPSETDLQDHMMSTGHKGKTGLNGGSFKEECFPSTEIKFDNFVVSDSAPMVDKLDDDHPYENLKELDVTKKQQNSHLGENVGDKTTCEQCGKKYSVDLLHSHDPCFSLQTGERIECRYCHKRFLSYRSVISHMRVHTGIDKPFKCTRCSKSYVTRTSLDIHYATHTKGKQECHICGKMVGPAFLNSHVRSHNASKNSKDAPTVCEICGNNFQSMCTLAAHQFSEHDVNEDAVQSLITFKCPHCKEEMQNKPTFIAHVATHTGVYPFECNICDKGFLYRGVLRFHVDRYHCDTSRKDVCKMCGKEFFMENHLHRQKQGCSLTWSFVCEECGRGFRLRDTYQEHMKMHKGQVPFQCDLCAKTFTGKRNWVAHEQIHAEDKSYRCDECNRGFRQKNGLSINARNVRDIRK